MKPVSAKFSRPTTAKKQEKPKTHREDHREAQEQSPPPRPLVEGETDITELMDQLIISQKQCEKSGKYVQAESYKRKVRALQDQLQKRDFYDIKHRHDAEKREIEQAHLQELNCFNIQWSEKIAQLQNNVATMEEELITKHQQQLRLIEEEINADRPYRFKQSAQLLNLKKIEQELARQENYIEAHQVQQRAQRVQKQELEKWKKDQSNKCKTSLNTLKIKQENELNALKQRITLNYDEKRRQKEQQQDAIILKYQNVLKELEYQQKQEIMKYEKSIKMKGMQKKTKISLNSTSKVSLS